MTLGELYLQGSDLLESADIDSPSVDAFYLMEHILGINRAEYLMKKELQVTPFAEQSYMELIRLRAEHIPYQYITGEADFMGLKFSVTPDVLIPRLDTEVLADEVLKRLPENARVLDMCTGSGCLGVTVKKMRQDAVVTASDISEQALAVARGNAQDILGDPDGIRFIKSDLFDVFADGEIFDVIVSNPPYVTEGEYEELSAEVKDHEPSLALLAGNDGLDIYKRLIPASFRFIAPAGLLALEIGYQQGHSVRELMEQAGFKEVEVIRDLAGLDRVVLGRKPS